MACISRSFLALRGSFDVFAFILLMRLECVKPERGDAADDVISGMY